ncbi:MAG: glycosyltransferase family 2 protein [Microgenomates group bacterium]
MKNKQKLSIVIATYNEADNIKRCLDSINDIADEIIIVDGESRDTTVEIAKKYSKVTIITTTNKPNFHINKQIGIEACKNEWIFLLDADEEVSPQLAKEITNLLSQTSSQITLSQSKIKNKLLLRHQKIVELRDGNYDKKDSEYTAFFVPRLNYFLGKFIRYGGVYPDGQVRLFQKSCSRQPAKDVHEQISTDGRVGWLQSDLYHYADPTFSRYLLRNNRYTSNIATELQSKNIKFNFSNFILYFFIKPIYWFLLTYFRHKGLLDGFAGFVFSFYSSLRFPIAYIKYYELAKTNETISLKKDWD